MDILPIAVLPIEKYESYATIIVGVWITFIGYTRIAAKRNSSKVNGPSQTPGRTTDTYQNEQKNDSEVLEEIEEERLKIQEEEERKVTNKKNEDEEQKLWFRTIHNFVFGVGVGVVIFLQLGYYVESLEEEIWIWIALPIVCGLLNVLAPYIGIGFAGGSNALMISQIVIDLAGISFPETLPAPMVIEAIGFGGLMINVLLELHDKTIFTMFFCATYGSSLIMRGISCAFWAGLPIVHPLDFKPGETHYCTPSTTTTVGRIVFLSIMLVGGVIGCIFQEIFASIHHSITHKSPDVVPQTLRKPVPSLFLESLTVDVYQDSPLEYLLSKRNHVTDQNKRLQRRLNERKERSFFENSVFIAVADQLSLLRSAPEYPSSVKQKVRGVGQREERDSGERDIQNVLKILQHVSSVYMVTIYVVTSLLEPKFILRFHPYNGRARTNNSEGSLYLSYNWGRNLSSLERRKPAESTELLDDTPVMRHSDRPYTRMALNRVVTFLIAVIGLWWIVWMLVFGHLFDDFWTGLSFLLYFIAELINYVLTIIYNMNFMNPIQRRWKSLNQLNPKFREATIVNTLICHYTEPPKDTMRTVAGALRMETAPNMGLNIYVCDDGFWKSPPVKKPLSCWDSFKRLFVKPNEKPQEKQESEYLGRKDSEKQAIEFVTTKFGHTTTGRAAAMVDMMQCVLSDYVYEKTSERESVEYEVSLQLTTDPNENTHPVVEGNITRPDCAVASLCYEFKFTGKWNPTPPIPKLFLVARAKPEKHHNKAGNINNCIYNQKLKGDFVAFLDNDMKPKPNFIFRTLPWFFLTNGKYVPEENQSEELPQSLHAPYRIDTSIAFVQAPQFFKESTVAPSHDFLGGRNSIFFRAIQMGRDGFDLCAFAGTNAVFRLKALYSIGGIPYGSLTEDAYCGILLHRKGYRSIYVEDKVAVGLAPTTVANAMQQRSRWVKGSVQIFMINFGCGPKDFKPWSPPEGDTTFSGDTVDQIRDHNVPPHELTVHNTFKTFFALDTMTYPFSAFTALLYIIVAILFVITGKPPLSFLGPLQYRAFLVTFLPYFILRFLGNYLSYNKVKSNDIWIAQEVWFSYGFASLFGITDALKERFTGKGFEGWGVTGEGKRTSRLEWINVFLVLILVACIVVRFVYFLSEENSIVYMAAIIWAGSIVIQLWPMAATTLYEWIYNTNLPPLYRKDLERIEVPTYVAYTTLLIVAVLASEFGFN